MAERERLLSAIDQSFPKICGPRTVWTTGRITLEPGSHSIIPGKAEALFQLRDADPAVLDRLHAELFRLVEDANKTGRCQIAINVISQSTPARMDERISWIRDEAGSRFDGLELSTLRLLGEVTVTNRPLKTAAEVARRLEADTGLSIEPRDVLESPYSLIGPVPDLVAKLREGRQRWGINSMLVGWLDEDLSPFAPVVEQLADT